MSVIVHFFGSPQLGELAPQYGTALDGGLAVSAAVGVGFFAPSDIVHVADGLVFRPTPNLPRRYQLRCPSCRCSVAADHVPGTDACQAFQDDRALSMRGE